MIYKFKFWFKSISWLLIERCWDLDPAARPDFTDIYLELNRINADFGLYGVNDTNQIADLGNNNNDENNCGDFHPDASTLHQQQPEQVWLHLHCHKSYI